MLPTRKLNSQSWLPDFFNDFFENGALDKSGGSVPAINVIEEERGYKLELAAPGTTKEDFKVHINRDGNLEIEMEKKKEVNTVVELDGFKMKWNTFRKPLVEVRDSL